jgi:hypothetical protein
MRILKEKRQAEEEQRRAVAGSGAGVRSAGVGQHHESSVEAASGGGGATRGKRLVSRAHKGSNPLQQPRKVETIDLVSDSDATSSSSDGSSDNNSPDSSSSSSNSDSDEEEAASCCSASEHEDEAGLGADFDEESDAGASDEEDETEDEARARGVQPCGGDGAGGLAGRNPRAHGSFARTPPPTVRSRALRLSPGKNKGKPRLFFHRKMRSKEAAASQGRRECPYLPSKPGALRLSVGFARFLLNSFFCRCFRLVISLFFFLVVGSSYHTTDA